jgi:hypothetical protein
VRVALDDAPFDPYALHWARHPDAPPPAQRARGGGDAGPSGLPKRAAVAPSPHGALSAALLSAARDGTATLDAAAAAAIAAANGGTATALGAGPSPPPAPPAPSLEVAVRATRWRGSHERYLEHTPFWGKFRVDQSLMQAHLAGVVPMEGLSDIGVQRPSKPEFLVRDRKVESEREPGLLELWEARGRGTGQGGAAQVDEVGN